MRIIVIIFLVALPVLSYAQKKVDRIKFCGVSYTDAEKMKEQLQEQFDFLKIAEGDTIVDIGAASGWYEGAFSVHSPLQKLHFILVDIDSSCLNKTKVDNMISHYSKLKGGPITHQFILVNNTVDSLHLPQNQFSKVWLMNVLHEIPDGKKMVGDIYNILRMGGELVVLEFMPKKPGQLHGGCHMPLRNMEEWKALLKDQGMQFVEHIEVLKDRGRSRIALMRFRKSG
jgi:ubiquinone/menaquinone biosynthesis C-methylase UbiE